MSNHNDTLKLVRVEGDIETQLRQFVKSMR